MRYRAKALGDGPWAQTICVAVSAAEHGQLAAITAARPQPVANVIRGELLHGSVRLLGSSAPSIPVKIDSDVYTEPWRAGLGNKPLISEIRRLVEQRKNTIPCTPGERRFTLGRRREDEDRSHAGLQAPPNLSRELLVRAVAHRMQELALGGLRPAPRRQLFRIAQQFKQTGEATMRARDRIQPRCRGLRGTALARRARHLQLAGDLGKMALPSITACLIAVISWR
jgi:hypothetical protein